MLCKEAQALDDQAAPAEASAPLLPPQAAAAGLPEAPAKMARVLQRYPVAEGPTEVAQTPKETPEGWCKGKRRQKRG